MQQVSLAHFLGAGEGPKVVVSDLAPGDTDPGRSQENQALESGCAAELFLLTVVFGSFFDCNLSFFSLTSRAFCLQLRFFAYSGKVSKKHLNGLQAKKLNCRSSNCK